MARSTRTLNVLSAALVLASIAGADVDPTLTINGATGDNTTVVELTKFTPLTIAMTGTPGAPFGLLLSLDANQALSTGFFLQPLVDATDKIDSPIHPVFDGIGMTYIAGQLGIPAGDFVTNMPSPIFRFDANGNFVLNALVPPVAVMVDNDAAETPTAPFGPTKPIVIPLVDGATLFLQVVSLDMTNLTVRVGNGIRCNFQAITHSASIAYSQGVATSASTVTVGGEQTVGIVADTNLDDGVAGTFTVAPEFASDGFPTRFDMWMIALAGHQEANATSSPPDGTTIVDSAYKAIQGYASSIEVFTGTQPARNNENFEFPRIECPGNKALFHWRNGTTAQPTYGFGILFKDTNQWRNLVPSSFATFTESATRSPWEIEVGVTPDGKRALVVLDQSSSGFDRLFLLNLEPGGTFSNGQPIREATPTANGEVRRVWEEGISFVLDNVGGYFGFFPSTNSASTLESLFPNRLWKVHMNGIDQAVKIIPSPGEFGTFAHVNRTSLVNAARDSLCVVAGPGAQKEDVISFSKFTVFGSYVPMNITAFPNNFMLVDDLDTSDGTSTWASLSKDGSVYAGARQVGADGSIPFIAQTNGQGAGNVQDLIFDVSSGGLFDTVNEFKATQGLHLTDDNKFLLFHQGKPNAGAASDNSDLFVINVNSGKVLNLTRSLGGPEYADKGPGSKALEGPWDLPASSTDLPTVDYGGSFLSPDRGTRYFFHDQHLTLNDLYNLYAVAVGSETGTGDPSFKITNVTGTSFEETPGAGKPPFGTPDLLTNSGFFNEQVPSYVRVRRVGGAGALANFYYFSSRLRTGPPGENNIENLFLFDGNNPGPALRLTAFGTTTTPIAVENGATITSVTPSQIEPKVAYVLNRTGKVQDPRQEVVMQDLNAFGDPLRLPDNGGVQPAFNRAITAGSLRWLSGFPSGLVYMAGSLPKIASPTAPSTDGQTTSVPDAYNPVDATPFFVDPLSPAFERKFVADPAVGQFRSGMIYNVK